MATIALYADKINQMAGLVKEVKTAVTDYKTELLTLKTKAISLMEAYVIYKMLSVPYRHLHRHRKRK